MRTLSRHSLDTAFHSQLRYLTTTLRPGTFVTYRAAVNRFLHFLHAAFPEVQQLSQLRRDPHILAWLGHLCEQNPPLANGSRRNYLWAMRRVLEELAFQSGCLPKVLILGDDFPPADHYLPRPLSPEDDSRLQEELRSCDDVESKALLLMRATGIRIGECLRLTTDCLRHIGEDQWALHVPLGKLHTERWVPVDDATRHIVDRILSLRQAARLRIPAELSHYLLPQTHHLPTSYHRIRQALNAAAQRAGCSARILPHQLRHYASSRTMLPGRTGSGFGPSQASSCSAGWSLSRGIVREVLVIAS